MFSRGGYTTGVLSRLPLGTASVGQCCPEQMRWKMLNNNSSELLRSTSNIQLVPVWKWLVGFTAR